MRKIIILIFSLLVVPIWITGCNINDALNIIKGVNVLAAMNNYVNSHENIENEIMEEVVLPTPPSEYYLDETVKGIEVKAELEFVISQTYKDIGLFADQIYNECLQFSNLAPRRYVIPKSKEDESLPSWIPDQYNGESIITAIIDDEVLCLVYGEDFATGRYLIVMDKYTHEPIYIFDFIAFAHLGKNKEIYQNIICADEDNGILYVSHRYSGYASENEGQNAYITAIRLSDQKILWRTDPLVSNSYNFEIAGDIIISGYGFTDESDYIYLINKSNGKVINKTEIEEAPDYIWLKDDNLYVRTDHEHYYKFLIKRLYDLDYTA